MSNQYHYILKLYFNIILISMQKIKFIFSLKYDVKCLFTLHPGKYIVYIICMVIFYIMYNEKELTFDTINIRIRTDFFFFSKLNCNLLYTVIAIIN